MPLDTSTPVLILGGKENALSLARHLGRHGIPVRASGPTDCWGMYSRYCRESFPVPRDRTVAQFWQNLLLSDGNDELHGHVILPCSDEAIEFVADFQPELNRYYLFDAGKAELRRALLDKRKTLELAHAAGIDAPNFWTVRDEADIENLRSEAKFPLIVKPIHSHRFSAVFGQKLFIIESDFSELVTKLRLAQQHGLEVMVVEMIPGPDDLLNSYYTYVDENGKYLFHYTKRIIRRYPVNRGNACHQITEWLPETAAAGRKFFEAIDLRGLIGNVEFKRDTRDGKLKVIEINARFTAAQELLVASGLPLDLIVYCHLTGQPLPEFGEFRQFLRYWYPARDFLAFLQMRKSRQIGFVEWARSLRPFDHVSPLYSMLDPMPCFGAAGAILEKIVRGRR